MVETLEASLAQVTSALKVVAEKLKGLSSDALTVEFGLTLAAETGSTFYMHVTGWSRGLEVTGGGAAVASGRARPGPGLRARSSPADLR
jgi:hypothetical protein